MRSAVRREDSGSRLAGLWVGGLLVAGALLTAAWVRFGLPVPGCRFREWTGLSCATCGTTRMFQALSAGDPVGAFVLNPLVFAALALLAVGSVVTVATGRLPVHARAGRLELVAAAVLFIAGWAYQIWRAL